MNSSRTFEVVIVDSDQIHWLACNGDYMKRQQGAYGETPCATARKLRR